MNLVLLHASEVPAPEPGTLECEVVLTDARAAHLRDILKVAPGQRLRIGIVDGPLGIGSVTTVSKPEGGITLRCVFEGEVPPAPPVDLLLALPRPKVMRRLWAQLAAIGVGRIMLTSAQRVEPDYWATHILTAAYYRPLLLEGLQQARDTRLPVVSMHRRFRVLIEDELDALAGPATRIVAHPGAAASVDQAVGARGERVIVAVGPEGGWNDFELRLLEQHGFERVGIGPRALRTDTACIALLALTHAALTARLV